MTTPTNFQKARTEFLTLTQTEGMIVTRDMLQQKLNSVAQAFYDASNIEREAGAAEMEMITTTAATLGLQKPTVKAPAL